MTTGKYREVRPRAAQRPDKKWVPAALVFFEREGETIEQEFDWPDKSFDTHEDAIRFANQAGEAWLDQKLGSKP